MKQSTILLLGFLCFFLLSCNNVFHEAATPPLTYTVTFDENGGDTPASPRTMTVTPPEITLKALPTPPKRAGYGFAGWADEYGLAFTVNSPVTESMTVYARWNFGAGHTVTFFSNGGSEVSSQSISHGENAVRPVNPDRSGYTFDNWYGSPELTTRYDFSTPVTSDVFIYAKWKNNAYQVNYNASGGSGNMPGTSHEFDIESALRSNTYTREGYTFIGWNTRSDGSGTPYADMQLVKTLSTGAAVTLYAQWFQNIPNTYIVRFHSNGGTLVNPQAVVGGKTAAQPWNPSRDGYEFGGWYNDQSLYALYTFSSPVTSDVDLYAKWNLAPTYTVTYEKNAAGATGTTPNSTHTYNAENPLSVNGFALDKYTFASWSTGPGGSGVHYGSGERVKNIGAVTLYANWKAGTYTVTYDKNAAGAIGVMSDSVHTFNAERVLNPNGFTLEGYTFNAWNTEANGSGAYYYADMEGVKNLTDRQGDKVTLYAQWTQNAPNMYIVRFHSNGGNLIETQFLRFGDKITQPDAPARAGYTFVRWYKDSGLKTPWNFASDTVSGDTNLYAGWEPVTYTVTYNANGAAGSTANSTHRYDTESRLSANGFTYTGYAFVSWNTQANGQGTHYAGGQNVKNLSTAAAVTLYANWKPAVYTVRFHSNGGDVVGDQFKGNGEQVVDPSASGLGFRTGYTFDGWYKEVGMTNLWNFASDTVSGDTNLYAKWTAISYTIEYDKNNNDASGTTPDSSHTYDVPKNLTANGYATVSHNFNGWALSDTGAAVYGNQQSVKNLSATPDGTVTLYATWEIKRYTVTFDSNEGSAVAAQKDIPHGSYATRPGNPTRTGYTFDDWYLGSTASPYDFANTPVTDDITLTARWTPITYTVKYNINGGDNGTMSDSDHTYDVSKNLNKNTFTRTGYTFAGWTENDNGSGASYSDEASVINLRSTTGVYNLYARWTPITYTVRYNSNTADTSLTGSMPDSTFTYDVWGDLRTNTFSRLGYRFTKWTENDNGTGESYTNGQSVLNLTATAGAIINIFAQWEEIPVRIVTFDSDNGDPPFTQNVNDGEYATQPADPSREGYNFGGWYLGGSPYNFATPVISDITLVAQWNIITYRVRFISNGTTYDTQDREYGEKASVPTPDPTRLGYTFGGWYKDNDTFTSVWDFNTDTVTKDTDLYARWTAISYTVTYNGNGNDGGGPMSDSPRTYDDSLRLSKNTFTLMGYDFAGWAKTAAGPVEYSDEATGNLTTVNGSIVELYAQWKTKQYTVSFISNGETYTTQPVNYNSKATNPGNPTRTGYTFGGWYKDNSTFAEEWNFDSDIVTKDTDLYAKWTANTYYVTYDANTGSGTAPAPQSYTYGGTPITISGQGDLTKDGHKFGGWNTQADGLGANYSAGQSYSTAANLDLYAVWIADTLTVTFNGNGGTPASSTKDVNYGEKVSPPADPTRTGYTFDTWYLNGSPYNFGAGVIADITLTAEWIPIQYTVIFDSNQGTNVTSPVYVDYGEKVSEPNPNTTRTGYTLDGWYYNNNKWDFTSDTVAGNMTLTAQWTINQFSVTFDSDGGSTNPSPQSNIPYGGFATDPGDPTKTNYTFAGWYDGATKWNFETTQVTKDTMLTAKWDIITLTVTFSGNWTTAPQVSNLLSSSSNTVTVAVDSGSKASKPGDPSRTGYTFVGWYNIPMDSIIDPLDLLDYLDDPYDFDTEITGNLTLYAIWTSALSRSLELTY